MNHFMSAWQLCEEVLWKPPWGRWRNWGTARSVTNLSFLQIMNCGAKSLKLHDSEQLHGLLYHFIKTILSINWSPSSSRISQEFSVLIFPTIVRKQKIPLLWQLVPCISLPLQVLLTPWCQLLFISLASQYWWMLELFLVFSVSYLISWFSAFIFYNLHL